VAKLILCPCPGSPAFFFHRFNRSPEAFCSFSCFWVLEGVPYSSECCFLCLVLVLDPHVMWGHFAKLLSLFFRQWFLMQNSYQQRNRGQIEFRCYPPQSSAVHPISPLNARFLEFFLFLRLGWGWSFCYVVLFANSPLFFDRGLSFD